MKKNGWAVLNYEIQMYLGARHLQGFPFVKSPLLNELQTCALVEVKALHIRILVEMFLERKQADDINIDDIFPDWRNKHVIIAHNLENAYKKKLKNGYSSKTCLNKFLVHPDKRRGDSFNWGPIIEIMDPSLKEVIRTLPKEKLSALQIVLGKYLDN